MSLEQPCGHKRQGGTCAKSLRDAVSLQTNGHVLPAQRPQNTIEDDLLVSIRVEDTAGVDLAHARGVRVGRELQGCTAECIAYEQDIDALPLTAEADVCSAGACAASL